MVGMSKGKRITRRQFLKGAAVGAAAVAMPAVVPTSVFGSAQRSAPSDRITLGFIGLGGMGMGHLNGFLGNGQVQVLAVCDVYAPHRDRAKKAVDNRYGNQDCAAYTDFRYLLDRKDIDAVVISTPDHWHTLISIMACESGKDVYCEKPLTLFVDEGKALVRAVRRYNRVFQVGSQQRSDYYFWLACMLVRNGKIGKVHTVRVNLPAGPDMDPQPDVEPPPDLDWNLYLGPAPWVPFNYARFLWNFRWFWDYSGGEMTDWGHHHFDIAQWGLGTDLSGPVSVEGKGVPPVKGMCETYVNFEVHYEYANGVHMIATTPERGVRFEGTDGYVHVWRGGIHTSPKELQQITWAPNDVQLYRSLSHHQNWLDCIRTRKKPICDVEIGHRSVTVAHIGNIAMRLGRKLRWDPVKEQFVDDPEANRWLSRPYRAPWYLR
jgi:predicted dehydrogenase